MMHEVITHNLLLLLRLGAFDYDAGEVLLPMSQHKWRRLVEAAAAMNVLRYVRPAAEKVRQQRHVSPVLYDALAQREDAHDRPLLTTAEPRLYNRWTQHRLEDVRETEMNSATTSEETLIVLDHVVRNAMEMITHDINVSGIVDMGVYIRANKERVNYTRLQEWFDRIGLVQIASLEGRMLIDCMGFSEDELPFVRRRFKNARSLFMHSFQRPFEKHSLGNATRMDVAMLETLTHRLARTIHMVTDIEE